jgi:uncharacterized protein YndB with AHSA1/START domain
MGTKTIHKQARSTAAPTTVFALLADSRGWPSWAKTNEARLEREGAPVPDGLGAIRWFRTGRTKVREEIVAFEPPRQVSYTLLEGMALRDYRADVVLTPSDGGTLIEWRSSFRPALPGTGWIYKLALGHFIQQTADLLATGAAARTESTARTPAVR